MSFTIFQNEETPLQALKTRTSKSRKTDIFPIVLTHSFGPKIAIFLNFFSQAIQARKMSFVIFQNEKTPFQAIKTRTSKSRKIDIFFKRVNPWFSAKNGHFLNFFLFGNIGKENVFCDILERKTPLQALKPRSSKSRKI